MAKPWQAGPQKAGSTRRDDLVLENGAEPSDGAATAINEVHAGHEAAVKPNARH